MNKKYDSHSREHSLRCQIGQCLGWIRIYEAKGNLDRAISQRNKMARLQQELDIILGKPVDQTK